MFSNFIQCKFLFVVKYIHNNFLCKFKSLFGVLFTSKNIFWRISFQNSFSRFSFSGLIIYCNKFICINKYNKTSTNSAIWLDETKSPPWEIKSKYCFSVASSLTLPREHISYWKHFFFLWYNQKLCMPFLCCLLTKRLHIFPIHAGPKYQEVLSYHSFNLAWGLPPKNWCFLLKETDRSIFFHMRFNFYLLRTFCPHLGSFFVFFCVVSSFTTFRPNFTSGLLQVIYQGACGRQ